MRPIAELINAHWRTIARGVLMGGADIVPGVSGGTVALVVGIYERFVTAISHFDLDLLKLLRQKRWAQGALHVDLPLLVPLGLGILIGFAIMTILMHFLLSTQQTRSLTMAMFFGLIFASGILVALMIRIRSVSEATLCFAAALLGVAVAWWVAGLNVTANTSPHLGFIFLSGSIAICAMILPGISGAMILLILGVYIHLTEIPGNLLRGREVVSGLVTVFTFACGCAAGLVTFSKLLHWLLKRYHAITMAVLCGFMFGSLRKLWPFQIDLTPDIEKIKLKTFTPTMPAGLDGHVIAVLTVFVGAVVLVLTIDWLAHGQMRQLLTHPGKQVK